MQETQHTKQTTTTPIHRNSVKINRWLTQTRKNIYWEKYGIYNIEHK